MLKLNIGEMEPKHVLASMKLFGEKVLPLFRYDTSSPLPQRGRVREGAATSGRERTPRTDSRSPASPDPPYASRAP